MLMDVPVPGLSPVQTHGTRPPGLPQDVRFAPEWEQLRREIYKRAIRFTEHLNFDFRERLSGSARTKRH
jgi:hypothetical protein